MHRSTPPTRLTGALLGAIVALGGVVSGGAEARAATGERDAVLARYSEEFDRTEPDHGWTGDTAQCRAGTTTEPYQRSVLQRINWYRSMAGLPPVELDSTHNEKAQAAALIGAANRKITHWPETNAACYSAAGAAGAGGSNLALGNAGVDAVDAYIRDDGTNNAQVGHRAWLLSPELGTVATGDIPVGVRSNALFINTRSAVRATPRDGAVAWPPAGHVPDTVIHRRWSYSRAGAEFTNAVVTVSGAEGPVNVVVEDRGGFLDPGMVFVPDVAEPTNGRDLTYTVRIEGIQGGGASSVSYAVTMVHINRNPRVTGWESRGGLPVCAAVGTRIGSGYVSDPESETVTYTLAGEDAGYFSVNPEGQVHLARTLDLGRTVYNYTLIATDPSGSSGSWPVESRFAALTNSSVCPAHDIVATLTTSGVKVSWKAPGGVLPARGYRVVLQPGNKSCVTKKTTCTVKVTAPGEYTVKVTSVGAGSSTSVEHPAVVKISRSSNTAVRTLRRGDRITTKTLATGIIRPVRYTLTGPCRLEGRRTWVRAGGRPGVCTVKISYRVGSATKTRTVALKII